MRGRGGKRNNLAVGGDDWRVAAEKLRRKGEPTKNNKAMVGYSDHRSNLDVMHQPTVWYVIRDVNDLGRGADGAISDRLLECVLRIAVFK